MKKYLLIVLCLVIFNISFSEAIVFTTYTSYSSWAAAVGSFSTENFNETAGTFTSRDFGDFSATLYNRKDSNTPQIVSNRLQLQTWSCDSYLRFSFDNALTALGFDWQNTDGSSDKIEMTIAGQNWIFGNAGSSGFFGVVATGGTFTYADLGDSAGNGGALANGYLDNFRYTAGVTNNPTLSVSNTNFGNVRVGTSATASVTVTNTGESGSTLTGNISSASGSEFTPNSGTQSFSLDQNQATSRTFTYTPTDQGTDSETITVSSNEDGSDTANLTGTGVTPVFSSSVSPGSEIDFGMIHLNTAVLDHPDIPPTVYETITISNITTDADLGNLTDLSILDAYITGDGTFDIIDFTPTVLGKDGTLEITIRYSTIMAYNGGVAPSQGIKNAVLTIVTDQNAAFGEAGDVFTFNLTGEVVPEINTIFLLGFSLLITPFFFKRK